MYDAYIDGRLQVTAAVSLLEFSRLVQWNPNSTRFIPVPRQTFEFSWEKDVDPVFGRLICWINFSAGAEFLAKGVCLLHNVEIRSPKEVPAHPRSGTDMRMWVTEYRKDRKSLGTRMTRKFGTLGDLTRRNSQTKADAALKRLCVAAKATDEQQELLLAAYDFLAETIRNRDSHAYVPKVRDDHFSVVPELFVDCFNLLVSWLPGGPVVLTNWRDEAREFVASL
jgi:hypothetical protein